MDEKDKQEIQGYKEMYHVLYQAMNDAMDCLHKGISEAQRIFVEKNIPPLDWDNTPFGELGLYNLKDAFEDDGDE